jgi:hypothetical protein
LTTDATPQAGGERQRRLRIGAVIAVAVAVGFIVWAAIGSGDDNGGGDTSSTTAPVAVSYDGLTTLVAAVGGQPVYWVGPRGGTRYEVQQLPDGTLYVRYLPADVEAGDPGKYLTVATYPMEDAYSVTSGHATAQGSQQLDAGEGAVAFSGRNSVYVAYDGLDQQIEVYDPTPGVARRLVSRGALAQVPTERVAEAKAVTPRELTQLSTSLGQPIYWAGRAPGATYELTQNAEGWVYVRYLSDGVEVGDPDPRRTIGTYPFSDAFEQTKALGEQPGMELVKLDDGGIGVFREGPGARQGYVAYPDADFQVEVFDPTPGAAAELIRSGAIVPVG